MLVSTPARSQVRTKAAVHRWLLPILAAAAAVFVAPVAMAGAVGSSASVTARPSVALSQVGLVTPVSQQAEWLDPSAAADDFFGRSVAVSGDTALVSAWREAVDGVSQVGVVYV
jgi:hypothetical protein